MLFGFSASVDYYETYLKYDASGWLSPLTPFSPWREDRERDFLISMQNNGRIHALLFGLSEDLAGELLQPLTLFCADVKSHDHQDMSVLSDSPAQVIFCGANVGIVNKLRDVKPEASIIVVSRHPEVTDWLDSIEAGANDYCAAPFETSQLKWILESSLRSQHQQQAQAA